MAGDTSNAKLWAGADVYVDFDRSAEAPTDVTTDWATGWEAAGLLDPEEGFTEAREDGTNEEFWAWGGVLVKKARGRHKRTIKFVALEDNETTFRLVNPGSTRDEDDTTGVTTSDVKVPKYETFAIGFEVQDGDEIRRRIVDKAEIEEIDEIKDSETNLTVYGITVVLYPSGDGTLYTELSGPAE